LGIGNKPIDGGHYLFTDVEKAAFLKLEPGAERFFRRWIGADEFLNGYERWCLWLGDASAAELRGLPRVLERVQAVRTTREASKSPPTQKLALTPTRFHVENIPDAEFLVIPGVSSENRSYIPIGYENPPTMPSNLLLVATGARLLHFGILSSHHHNAWMRTVAGRLKSDYRYSKDIVYNNFPWPWLRAESELASKFVSAIEEAAQRVLDARATGTKDTLADLYDPLTMPANLVKAHQALDAAVDRAYTTVGGPRSYKSEAERVAFLMTLYQRYEAELAGS
jgi:hypothetical protein